MTDQLDPYLLKAAAPGTIFEIGERDGLRQFVNAPMDLSAMIETARRHGERTFIVEGDRRVSYAQLFDWRDRMVPLLKIAKGDRVGICMRNRAEWIIAFLAVIRAGGVAVLFNSRGAPDELAAMVAEATPALVIADSERAAKLTEGGYAGRLIDLTGPEAAAAQAKDLPPAQDFPAIAPDDPCTILFTSGTTGRPKGAVLTHRSLITGLLSVQMSGLMILHKIADDYGISAEQLMQQLPQQAVMLVFPLFHISGLGSAFLSPLFSGHKIVMMRRWDAQEAMRLVEAEKVTMISGVPTMMWDMLNSPAFPTADLSSLTNIGIGGQATPVRLVEAINAGIPSAAIGTGYGMTECSGSVAQSVGGDFVRKPASAGRVLPMVEMAIRGPDGQELPQGEAGEITVRGAMVMQGYWNRPEETAQILSPDGWLTTGDVGYIDEEGYVFIIDRKKDMVISSGENIYCAEVERVITEMHGIHECATFGLPDERLGEKLVAVVRADGVSANDIAAEVSAKLASYKAPAEIAFTAEHMPRTATGKVDKRALKARWPELIGEK
ncbi:MAG: acyl--CoA ligase [Sphingomonadaceae bacterium]|nr:acyl--CoA ligase [Sphingomonadaceae bacterium]